MRTIKQQSGFAILELVLAVVIIAAITVAGLAVYHKTKLSSGTDSANGTPSSQSSVARNVSTAPAINSTSDLDKALATLDQNNPATTNSSDQSQLDSQASF